MRLIYAEDVLYALVEEGQDNATKYGFHIGDTIKFTPTQVDEIVSRMPTVELEPHWIPCSERLPEAGKDVMVCYDFKGHRSVLIGVLYGDETFHGYDDEYLTPEGRKYRKAVAWMPLPEPYGGDNK